MTSPTLEAKVNTCLNPRLTRLEIKTHKGVNPPPYGGLKGIRKGDLVLDDKILSIELVLTP